MTPCVQPSEASGGSAAATTLLRVRGVLAKGRAARVACLIIVIGLLSIGDLILTLTYVKSVGMNEQNPIARWIMSHDSSHMLVAFKCASVLLASVIFWCARKRLSGEAGALACALLLVWLTARWTRYTDEAPRLTQVLHTIHELPGGQTWVQMEE